MGDGNNVSEEKIILEKYDWEPGKVMRFNNKIIFGNTARKLAFTLL